MSAFARSYARASLESAPAGYDVETLHRKAGARSRGAVDRNSQLREFFAAPAIPRAAEAEGARGARRAAPGVDDFGRRLLGVVLAHGRLTHLVGDPRRRSRTRYDRTRGRNEAHVTVAAPIDAGARSGGSPTRSGVPSAARSA